MTISSTVSRWEYIGDGSTQNFTYNNKIFQDSDLEVYEDGSLQTLSTDYTVTGAGSSSGGEVQFVSAPANNTEVTIVRDVANTQGSDYPSGGPLSSDTLEDDFDRRTIVSQELQEILNRTLKIPKTDQGSPTVELDNKATRADRFLKFDSSGNVATSATTPDGFAGKVASGETAISQWQDQVSASFDSSDTFTVDADITGDHNDSNGNTARGWGVSDRVKVSGSSTGVVTGTINSIDYNTTNADKTTVELTAITDSNGASATLSNESLTAWVGIVSNDNPSVPSPVVCRTLSDLQAASGGQVRYLMGRSSAGDGAAGDFLWDGSDLSTEVAADEVNTGEGDGGIYVAPATDKTGASGAWVRTDFNQILDVRYYGEDIQATVDAVQSNGTFAAQRILIPTPNDKAEYDQNVVIPSTPTSWSVVGFGWGTRINFTGTGHAFVVNAKDTTIRDLWIDNTGGPADRGGIVGQAEDLIIDNVAVDLAPLNCLTVTAHKNWIRNFKSSNVAGSAEKGISVESGALNTLITSSQLFSHETGLSVVADQCVVASTVIKNASVAGMVTSGDHGNFQLYIGQCAIGFRVSGSHNDVRATISGASDVDNQGAVIQGDENKISVAYETPSELAEGVDVSGSGNTIDANITLSSATNGRCVIVRSGANGNTLNVTCKTNDNSNAVELDSNNNSVNATIDGGSHGIVINGNLNSVHCNARNATNEEVQIVGNQNHVTGVINGDLTINGDNNIVDAVVTGTTTDSGTGNTVR